ncbi:MAG: DUF2059 domain-containing protein [Chromatiales bacterium]|nr:DUF2059 domain-containing protein [Chromatiales bacterium]
MKKVASVLLLLTVPFLAQAESSPKRETVERLLEVMDAAAVIETMYSQVDGMFIGMAEDLGIRESERPKFDRFMSKVAREMKEEMTWDKLKEPLIKIYLEHYSEKEMEDLLQLYSTDTGRSIIRKTPLVTQKSRMVSQSMIKDFMPRINELTRELKTELVAAENPNSGAYTN